MNTLSAEIYVTPGTKRDCETAAQLLGMPSGDHYAEHVIRQSLEFKMPEIAELQRAIGKAIREAKEAWQAKYPALVAKP
jgi:hypothetical protein